MIRRGVVTVNGEIATKPGATVPDQASIIISATEPHYVSRGGLKLEAALAHFGFSPLRGSIIDVGSSTGGFTDVLLRHGARRVFAVDVGRGQLHPSLRSDERVVIMEETDVRDLSPASVSDPANAIVSDVSFISLTQALPPAMALAAPGAWMVALIKPQFELDASSIGKGGIVKTEASRKKAIERVTTWLDTVAGWRTLDVIESPITGKGGNIEFLIGATRNE